ncbi:hypothetical protein Pflav_013300 [Phytohabitans flavus]|uniref:Ketosynthase family 3 (KS3) domain-containing protein n=1 Tax=Phytohabitans flavus TaxID=1076124 RepID=A0A6F8XM75_9ACTN|nr:polyketide synthase [Phytohabitans flavus]BCB74920.1 hypothetical protein Pflav_013300 [Phytohabitans flavus]
MNGDLKRVLELVQAGEISPTEGNRRLAALRAEKPAEPVATPAPVATSGRIAVVGMSCRFSGGASPEELWQSLVSGACSVREVPADRWDIGRYYDPDPHAPGRTNSRWGGFLDDVDAFDPLFFNLSGREAQSMDPQQRLFLEGCWTALEDAGYASDAVSATSCGVFAGAPASDYASESERCGADADARVMMGNDTAILAARISYLLNLRGPSVALNTACSSSLVAVHLASQAIESGQCEMALAGACACSSGPASTSRRARPACCRRPGDATPSTAARTASYRGRAWASWSSRTLPRRCATATGSAAFCSAWAPTRTVRPMA